MTLKLESDSFAQRSKEAQTENIPFSQNQTKILLMNQAITNPAQELFSTGHTHCN